MNVTCSPAFGSVGENDSAPAVGSRLTTCTVAGATVLSPSSSVTRALTVLAPACRTRAARSAAGVVELAVAVEVPFAGHHVAVAVVAVRVNVTGSPRMTLGSSRPPTATGAWLRSNGMWRSSTGGGITCASDVTGS